MNITIIPTPETALHAARVFGSFAGEALAAQTIDAGQHAAMLGRLPIEVLGSDTETLELLSSWGIRDCKSLANLDELPLVERLGEKGLHLQRLARGGVKRECVANAPLERFLTSTELEQALDVLEPLAFIVNRSLTQLMERLALRSLGTDHVQVELTLAPQSDRRLVSEPLINTQLCAYRRTLKLALPTQDAKSLLKLLQLDLAAHPPAAPITKITVEAFPAEMRVEHGNLFRRHGCDPAKIDLTLARLRAVMDQKDRSCEHVGCAFLSDSHRPDRCEMLPFLQDLNRNATRRYYFQQASRLRRFRPVVPASVEIVDESPSVVQFQRTRRRVMSVSGPWRLGIEWWNQSAQWDRDEWNVELSSPCGTGVYRIFQDHLSTKWFVEGIYD